jgi:hypothetical protein
LSSHFILPYFLVSFHYFSPFCPSVRSFLTSILPFCLSVIFVWLHKSVSDQSTAILQQLSLLDCMKWMSHAATCTIQTSWWQPYRDCAVQVQTSETSKSCPRIYWFSVRDLARPETKFKRKDLSGAIPVEYILNRMMEICRTLLYWNMLYLLYSFIQATCFDPPKGSSSGLYKTIHQI